MRLYRVVCTSLFLFVVSSLSAQLQKSNLTFSSLPTRWDESLPLGNGMLGAMVWQKNDQLRFSLDCASLWDERPMKDHIRAHALHHLETLHTSAQQSPWQAHPRHGTFAPDT